MQLITFMSCWISTHVTLYYHYSYHNNSPQIILTNQFIAYLLYVFLFLTLPFMIGLPPNTNNNNNDCHGNRLLLAATSAILLAIYTFNPLLGIERIVILTILACLVGIVLAQNGKDITNNNEPIPPSSSSSLITTTTHPNHPITPTIIQSDAFDEPKQQQIISQSPHVIPIITSITPDTTTLFSAKSLISHIHQMMTRNYPSSSLNALAFTNVSVQVINFMTTLGPAMNIAKHSLHAHILHIRKWIDDESATTATTPANSISLEQLVSTTIALKLQKVGKRGGGSAARSMLRLLWFFDFVRLFIQLLITNPTCEISVAAGEAYETVFAKVQPWIVRTSVVQSMKLLPTRKIWQSTKIPSYICIPQDFIEIVQVMNPASVRLWNILKENDLATVDKLP
jgi:hypothetical protein